MCRTEIIAAGYPENPDAPLQIAMVQTLVRRLDRLRNVSLSIVDEAHHIMASTWLKITNATPNARILGVTATPERLDGRGLGAVFDGLVLGPTVNELIASGWLVPFVVYASSSGWSISRALAQSPATITGDLARRMSADVVLGDAVVEYRKHLDGNTAIAFCTTIDHSAERGPVFPPAWNRGPSP